MGANTEGRDGKTILDMVPILDTNVFLHISACSRTVLLSPEDIAGQSTFGMASHGGGKIPLEIREAASALREVRWQASMAIIALLHVNCEGCEWEMLENIIQAGEHRHVR